MGHLQIIFGRKSMDIKLNISKFDEAEVGRILTMNFNLKNNDYTFYFKGNDGNMSIFTVKIEDGKIQFIKEIYHNFK